VVGRVDVWIGRSGGGRGQHLRWDRARRGGKEGASQGEEEKPKERRARRSISRRRASDASVSRRSRATRARLGHIPRPRRQRRRARRGEMAAKRRKEEEDGATAAAAAAAAALWSSLCVPPRASCARRGGQNAPCTGSRTRERSNARPRPVAGGQAARRSTAREASGFAALLLPMLVRARQANGRGSRVRRRLT